MQYVYVLNKHGGPLMPCSPGKARLLLKQQKACVVKRTPFTIKLLYGSAGYKQPITLGVDAGSKHVGLCDCHLDGAAVQQGCGAFECPVCTQHVALYNYNAHHDRSV